MKHLMKRVLSLLLCLSMIIAWVPAGITQASAAQVQTTGRVADPNTMNQWTDYFGPDMISTEFAGGVWTDKSVLTNANDFKAAITMDDPENNFLIALSAMAANQQIVGYASAPIDVMLVLDVSGSMQGDKAKAMVQATNETIESLLKQNNNNRVGVVLYSGNSNTNQNAGTGTATVILPLDRYTTNSTQTVGSGRDSYTIPAYFTISNNTVSVASTVKNSKNQSVSGSKAVSGGTYIQNGLYKAWGEFSQVTDVKVPAGQPQAGAQRTPVLVLMSDGQPTLATIDYTNIGTSQRTYGDGSENSTSWRTVFLTQLTASWVKSKMETKYGTTPKFYTLGLGTGASNYATAVLQPGTSYTTLDGYWQNFFDSSKLDSDNNVEIIPNTNRPYQNSNAWSVYKDSAVKVQNYSDMYKLAANTDELIDAFKQVVENIELDAAGHVTLVEAAGEDYSGYVTITDELGIFMDVKDVKGLVLGDTLFTGHELAESLQESSMGNQQNPTDYGNEFIRTVRERLGIDNVSDAQNLVIAAYADGQLAYDDKGTADESDDTYSNYIGWYSDSNGTYLGFWDKDTGITAEGAPEGATWINKSYGYLGTAGSSDMMHVVVMLCTHIESGMQVMQYKIPASLIPKVTYEIELNGSDPTDMKSITRKDASPLRLVYEVGLADDLNNINVAQKVNDAVNAGWGHSHINADGNYDFYTNKWGAEHGDSTVDYNDPMNHEVAQSHFHPAQGNDRYYYTEDTPVYADTNGTLYTGTAAPTGEGYYRAYHYYTASGYTTKYLPMSEYAQEQAAAKGQQADGCWYIPQGSVFQQIDRFKMLKESNPTGTLEYFDYPVVVDIGDKYDTYAFLGNNGRITIVPAQGIQLTKTVTETVEGAQDSFTFDITLSQAVENPQVTDTDGNELTGWSVNGNVITVTLKAGETVCVTGLPTGVTYTVTERNHADYIGSSENATGTVRAGTMNAVDFVNIPRGYGNLIISKDVDHPYTTVPSALTNKEFTINVVLSGEDVANKQFAIAGTDPVEYITTDANGAFSVTLKDNGSLTMVGLPEGTTFTTTETLDPDVHKGFTMDADRSVLTGTIVKDTAVQTHVVNVYEPAAPEIAVSVAGNKILTDEAGAFDWTGKSFTVRLEQYDPVSGTYTTLGEQQVTQGNLAYVFADLIRLDTLGDYYFKVSEVIPTERLEGMSYDATVGRFEVRVTDEDVDGKLELAVYDFDTKAPIHAENGVVTYTKDFENIHTTDATYVEFTVDKNVVDPHNTGATEAGYLFELYEVVNGVTSETAAYSMRTVLVDGQGQATFHIPITKVGSRTFILKENVPTDANKILGMVYDTTEYTVVVSATAEEGKLVPALSITKNGQEATDVVFTNEIDLEPVVLTPHVTKELVGREPLSSSEFTFSIVQTDGSFATPIQGGYSETASVGEGVATFADFTITQVGTYYFRVTEQIGTTGGMTYDNSIYHVTVNVTAENGELVKDVTFVKVGQGVASTEEDSIQFTNTYVNTDTEEVTFRGTKALTGRSMITGEFSFQLKQGEEVLQTVTNRADGSFVFEPITYTAADLGDHIYTVVEVNDGKGGVTYDKTVYTITVKVEDDGQGNLVVTTTGADAVAFNNSYYAQPVTVGFSGNKSWYNTDLQQNKAMAGGEFTFVLYATDENYSYQGAQVATATNKADGSFSMGFTYQNAGHYYYLLREQSDENTTVGYDASVYRIHIVVYDNGLGKMVGSVAEIVQEGTDNTTIRFNNTYTPEATQLAIEGVKELTGDRTLSDGEFTFQLIQNGEVLETVTNTNGKFTFSPIAYDKTGTYTYQVKEVVPQHAVNNVYNGITYDTTLFDVTVTVNDNNGQLEASYAASVNGSSQELKFVNEYGIHNFTDFDLSGSKVLWRVDVDGNVNIGIQGRIFRFAILDENKEILQTVTANDKGQFTFENVPLTETGLNTFTVVELDDGLNGIDYDDTVYTVTVDVAHLNGDLIAGLPVVTLNNQNAELTFNNTYTLKSTELVLQVEKVLDGKTLQDGQFEFELRDVDGKVLQTTTNNDTGEVIFDAISYSKADTYYYTINEVIPTGVINGITYDNSVIHVVVTVTDNGDGTLSAQAEYQQNPVFTNVYTVTGNPQVDISGTKKLTGRGLADGEFTFVLTDSKGNTTEVKNVGNGFTFEDVKLPGLGKHSFTVSEKNTGKGGITYDSKVYDVSVTVTDDGFGGMIVGAPVISYHGVATHLAFTNSYASQPAKYTVTAQKDYNKTLIGGEFTFTLTGEGENQTKTNAAGGAITFDELTFTEAKTYTYTVSETKGDKTYITYDNTVYTVSIKVEDNGLGQLEVTEVTYLADGDQANEILFKNTYTPAATDYILTAEKSYTKTLTGGEFTFTLTGEGVAQTKTNAAGGAITFDKLTFTEAKTYTYTVSETKGNKSYITYDDTVYTVKIVVEDDNQGKLVVTDVQVSDNKQTGNTTVKFDNAYVISGNALVYLKGNKSLTGKDLNSDMFTFQLFETDDSYSISGEPVKTAKNVGGIFQLALEYQSADAGKTFYYVLQEENAGQTIDGITYSSDSYKIKVQVLDDEQGGLKTVVTTDKNLTSLEQGNVTTLQGLNFTNAYNAKSTKYTITAEKSYTKTLTGGEFTFTLTGEGENQTKTNAAGGAITFDELTFTEAKTYTYTVSETKGDKDYITYDDTVYTVEIKVSDDGKGQLYVDSVTYKADSEKADEITFENIYTPAATQYILTAEKVYTKELTGGEFTFTLSGEGVAQTKTNAAGGAITFDELTFTEAKTYTYTVSETKGDKSYITYDDTVYTVTIEVEDDNQGQLFVKNVSVADDKLSGNTSVQFNNVYVITGEPVFSIDGTKTLIGRDLENGEFTFVLTDAQGNAVETTNVGTTFAFTNVALPGLGERSFTLTEKNTGDPYITYDQTAYTVTVKVVDDEEGGMTVEAPVITLAGESAEAVFSNTYTAPDPVTVDVSIEKTVEGDMSPEGFTFELVKNGQVMTTVETDADGKATISMSFTLEALGSHSFQLREVDDGVQYVTYDDTVYTIDVNIIEDGKGQLAATVQLDGKDVEKASVSFVNKFAPPATPSTGDSTNVHMLVSAMGISALGILVLLAVLLMEEKRRTVQK